jgi:hypothetical protein
MPVIARPKYIDLFGMPKSKELIEAGCSGSTVMNKISRNLLNSVQIENSL